uniref:Armadillo like helical domain containing 3 n=1 Tax=Ovis aries TaxID=9940 RepID=A0AC11DDB8_SHEEP
MGFSRQEYWSELLFPSPGYLPHPGIEPGSPALKADSLTTEPPERAIINHFNPKIESYAAVNHISQLSEEQVLEVVRANYDTLTLKLQDGLDQYERYSEQHKEAAFFKELVRSISTNVRRNLAFHTLSQEVLLKEFSTIS